jgi:protein O-mannosyl-transferase
MSFLPSGFTKRLFTPAVAAVAVSLVSLIAFLPALRNGFVSWDDGINLLNNPYFRGLGRAHLRWMWTNHLMEHYVPLTWMSFGLDYVLWKERGFGYHLTNILLHSVNAGLFFWLAFTILKVASSREFARSRAPLVWGAAFAALFFSLHPLRVESVAWVTERRDVLSGCFYLLALIAYLRRFPNEPGRPVERKYYWLSLTLFLASVLSKEITVTLPAALLILDVYPLRRLGGAPGRWLGASVRGIWIEKVPFFAVALADGIMTLYISLSHHVAASIQSMGWIPRITITVYGMAFYLRKTLVPSHLSALYPFTPYNTDPGAAPFLLSAAVVLATSAAAVALRRRFPGLLAVWVVYTVTLLPVGGIFHNGYQIAADRYTYVSCLGWALLAGAALSACWRATFGWPALRALLAGLAVLLLVALGWQTRAQIHFWHDSETLWGKVVSEEPSAIALNSLGAAYVGEGDSLGALELYRRAVAMDPTYAVAHNNLGGVFLELHRLADAMREFRIAQQLAPDLAQAYNGSGDVFRLEGKLDEAIQDYKRALQIDPDYAGARKNLGWASALKQSQSQQ